VSISSNFKRRLGQSVLRTNGKGEKLGRVETSIEQPEPSQCSARITLTKLDARVKIAANKVMSGNDELGSGSLTATLKNGCISIDPVQLV